MGFRDNRGGGHRSFHGGGGRGGGRGFGGPREMHDATCSDCGAACKVPFTPTPGRPVYCDACFPNHRPPRDGGSRGGYGGGRRGGYDSSRSDSQEGSDSQTDSSGEAGDSSVSDDAGDSDDAGEEQQQ